MKGDLRAIAAFFLRHAFEIVPGLFVGLHLLLLDIAHFEGVSPAKTSF